MARESPGLSDDVVIGWRRRPGDRVIRPRIRQHRLRRVLGTSALYGIGYGNVGASIYYALGLTALAAAGAAPVALALAGLFFVCTALTYSEGMAAFPEAGGSAVFARHAFNELVAFVAGWSLMLGDIVAISISAFTIPAYLGYFLPALKESPPLGIFVAMGIVAGLTVLNVIGVRESAFVNVLAAVLDLATQVTLVVLGLLLLLEPERLWRNMVDYWPDTTQLLYGVSVAMVAYVGLESVAQVAGEARAPGRRLPQAMGLVVASVLVIYGGVSLVALSAMTPAELSTTWATDPVAGIAASMPAEWLRAILAPLVAVLAASILLIATNAGILGVSRLAFSMSQHQHLPGLLSRVHPRFRTPHVAIVASSLAAVAVLVPGLSGGQVFRDLGALYGVGALLAFCLAHASILALRFQRPDLVRPFRLGVSLPFRGRKLPVTALVGLVGTGLIWLVVVAEQPYSRGVGLGWLAVGLVGYIVYRRVNRLPLLRPAPAAAPTRE